MLSAPESASLLPNHEYHAEKGSLSFSVSESPTEAILDVYAKEYCLPPILKEHSDWESLADAVSSPKQDVVYQFLPLLTMLYRICETCGMKARAYTVYSFINLFARCKNALVHPVVGAIKLEVGDTIVTLDTGRPFETNSEINGNFSEDGDLTFHDFQSLTTPHVCTDGLDESVLGTMVNHMHPQLSVIKIGQLLRQRQEILAALH